MRKIDYYQLGATLYIPILHKNLEPILKREKYPFLKSIVICLEDSTALCDLESGMKILKNLIETFKPTDLKVFVRPRDIKNLREILEFKNIDTIDGFALAKFESSNIAEYLSIFIKENHFYLMPILETKDVFNNQKLNDILKELEPFKERILVVRIGGEDILSMLNTMRDCHKTIYEIMPLYLVLSNIINIFKPNGYHISSTVYSCFGELNTLQRELVSDGEHQIFNKTSIHPKQVELIQESYKVTQESLYIAKKLLNEESAIFNHNNRMYEKSTHSNWAKSIVKRYENYGLEENG
ncbi:MAG: HpcH/HpaI aldolase/citrate lyase family protein [Campylobacterota bacterium]|nr:HpcH/HpaI aldolase/citrate lyase family protein [Campylobacterota bacterium]